MVLIEPVRKIGTGEVVVRGPFMFLQIFQPGRCIILLASHQIAFLVDQTKAVVAILDGFLVELTAGQIDMIGRVTSVQVLLPYTTYKRLAIHFVDFNIDQDIVGYAVVKVVCELGDGELRDKGPVSFIGV